MVRYLDEAGFDGSSQLVSLDPPQQRSVANQHGGAQCRRSTEEWYDMVFIVIAWDENRPESRDDE